GESNRREAIVGRAVPGKAIRHRHDAVLAALPFAYQDGTSLRPRLAIWPWYFAQEHASMQHRDRQTHQFAVDGRGYQTRCALAGERARPFERRVSTEPAFP